MDVTLREKKFTARLGRQMEAGALIFFSQV